MPRLENATVLMTRPMAHSERFMAELSKVSSAFRSVISPAFENVPSGDIAPDFQSAIFTSQAALPFVPEGKGRVAYCVGERTAQAAQRKGYAAISAQGSAADLVALILERNPSETLVHIRGENSVGNVTQRLASGGLACSDAIIYRKSPIAPSQQALEALSSGQNLILPLFSAETVSILAGWDCGFQRSSIVAISPTVAQEAHKLGPKNVATAPHPNQREMVTLTASMIA